MTLPVPVPSEPTLIPLPPGVLLDEAIFLLDAFQELKSLHDAELRLSVALDPQSREVEIIYAGWHRKKSLESLRRTYDRRRREHPRAVPHSVPVTGGPPTATR